MRRLLDHDVSMGCSDEILQGYQLDFLKDRAKRIMLDEAKSKEEETKGVSLPSKKGLSMPGQ